MSILKRPAAALNADYCLNTLDSHRTCPSRMVSPEELDFEAKSKSAAAKTLEEEAGQLEEQGWRIKAQGKLQEAADLRDEAKGLRQRALLLRQEHSSK